MCNIKIKLYSFFKDIITKFNIFIKKGEFILDTYRSTLFAMGILLVLSATFSASETALTAANKIRLKNQAESGDKNAAGALKLISKYDSALSALLISNNIVNILSSSLATARCIEMFGNSAVGIATTFTTIVVIIFGEVLPKSYANDNSERLIKLIQKPLQIIIVVLTPAIKVLEILKKILTGRMKRDTTPTVTERELMSIIDEIEDEGVLQQDEAELVQSAIEFNDISAGEVLTPRVDICAIDRGRTKDEILKLFLENNFSRMPVYEHSIDKIVGFVNQKDFFAALLQEKDFPLESVMKPCLYVPPRKKIIDIMHLLQKNKMHMAVVTDEYGGTLGILTLEDILEQLVGDIWDEHDEETQFITRIDEVNYEVLGEISMNDLYEKVLNTKTHNIKGYLTLSGYLMDMLNRIPQKGDTFDDAYIHYTVANVDDNRIKLVKVRVLQPEDFEV